MSDKTLKYFDSTALTESSDIMQGYFSKTLSFLYKNNTKSKRKNLISQWPSLLSHPSGPPLQDSSITLQNTKLQAWWQTMCHIIWYNCSLPSSPISGLLIKTFPSSAKRAQTQSVHFSYDGSVAYVQSPPTSELNVRITLLALQNSTEMEAKMFDITVVFLYESCDTRVTSSKLFPSSAETKRKWILKHKTRRLISPPTSGVPVQTLLFPCENKTKINPNQLNSWLLAKSSDIMATFPKLFSFPCKNNTNRN